MGLVSEWQKQTGEPLVLTPGEVQKGLRPVREYELVQRVAIP